MLAVFGTTYYILHTNERSECHLFALQYTGRLPRMYLAQACRDSEIPFLVCLFFYFSLHLNNKQGFGCDVAAHCNMGNSGRGRPVECILGMSFKSIYTWTFFSILHILLVFTYIIPHTTFQPHQYILLAYYVVSKNSYCFSRALTHGYQHANIACMIKCEPVHLVTF